MNTVWIVMPILIVLMFLLGTDLNRQAFANVARNPKGVIIGMTGQLVLLPLIAFTIASSPFIFNSGEMAIPAIIYALLMNVILLVYVAAIRKR